MTIHIENVGGGGGGSGAEYAPTGSTYIVQIPDATLTNEQALADLNTGLLYVTSGTGVLTNPTSFTITGTATCPTIKSTETISGTNISGAFTGTTLNISGTSTTITLKNTNLISGTNITATTITPLTLIVPNSNNPTLTVAGQISVDTSTTSNAQMRFYADAEYALPAYQSKSFVIVSPTTASDYIIWKVPYDITLKNYYVQCNGADNVIGALDIANGKGVTSTATSADVTSWNGSSTAATILNAVVNAGSYVNWHTTSISSTPLSVNITFDYIPNVTVL